MKHNSGGSTSTAHRKPFVVVHIEVFQEKRKALQRERYLRSPEGGSRLIEYLKKQHILDEVGRLNVNV